MRKKQRLVPPPHAATTTVRHVVAFYETDAMGVVHHSNYVRFLELARVEFLAQHDRHYAEYVALGFHVPVTRVSVQYHRACRFSDPIDVTCWLHWARHASMGFAYELSVRGELVACAETDHAIIDVQGRPQRIPEEMRERMRKWLGDAPPPPRET